MLEGLMKTIGLFPTFPIASGDGGAPARVALITGAFLLLCAIVTTYGVVRQNKGDGTAVRLAAAAQSNYLGAISRAMAAEKRAMKAEGDCAKYRELIRALGHDPDMDPDDVVRRVRR